MGARAQPSAVPCVAHCRPNTGTVRIYSISLHILRRIQPSIRLQQTLLMGGNNALCACATRATVNGTRAFTKERPHQQYRVWEISQILAAIDSFRPGSIPSLSLSVCLAAQFSTVRRCISTCPSDSTFTWLVLSRTAASRRPAVIYSLTGHLLYYIQYEYSTSLSCTL